MTRLPRSRSSGNGPPATPTPRLVVASNRLPTVLVSRSGGGWDVERGSGGLVTALEPVLRRSGGVWIGWPGVSFEDPAELEGALSGESTRLGYVLEPVSLSGEERDGFYLGFSNRVIWPLFHGFQDKCEFSPGFWNSYIAVNGRFAGTAAQALRPDDLLWIHDYHLMGVAENIRGRGLDHRIGFFLHTPFPPLEIFRKLPWCLPVLRSLLHYDLVGVQTPRDRENLLHTLRCLAPSVRLTQRGQLATVWIGPRPVDVGVFPISIDVEEFESVARATATERRLEALRDMLEGPDRAAEERGTSHKVMILGVDRLDYTKGIPHKLRGYRLALRKYPGLRGRVTLTQLVVPSREEIPEYFAMKDEIERLVGEISGEFMDVGWSPISYTYGSWDRNELVAHYRAAKVALVTPLKDGMNLVAKEYCAANADGDGVLILSEHAGAAAQLQAEAIMVNPYDVEAVARAIHQACGMEEGERRSRMARMRERIRREDIHWWARSFFEAATSRRGPVPAVGSERASPLPDNFMAGG